jgi:hypothetical protein
VFDLYPHVCRLRHRVPGHQYGVHTHQPTRLATRSGRGARRPGQAGLEMPCVLAQTQVPALPAQWGDCRWGAPERTCALGAKAALARPTDLARTLLACGHVGKAQVRAYAFTRLRARMWCG